MAPIQPTVWNHRFWLVAVIVGACIVPYVCAGSSACADPRPRPRQGAQAKPKKPSPARPEQNREAKNAKSVPQRECEVWPPRQLPVIVDLYQLKLEYDCRVLTLVQQRHSLATQEAKESVQLAEEQNSAGIDRKNIWYGREQAVLEEHQHVLEQWRDKALRNLQAMR